MGLFGGNKAAYSAVDAASFETGRKVHIENWPARPHRVRVSPWHFAADVALLVPPIGFIALAIIAYRLDGQPLSSLGNAIQATSRLGPTIYPLIFAALGGRSLKRIALFKAERGSKLGVLESLVGSQTLTATLSHAYTTRFPSLLAVGLILLWALSPLGGQSTLRLVSETVNDVSSARDIYYANVDASAWFVENITDPNDLFSKLGGINAMVSMSLLNAKQYESWPWDNWEHPRVPRLEEVEQDNPKDGATGNWVQTVDADKANYVSINGLPLMNLLDKTISNLTAPYEYLHVDCTHVLTTAPEGPDLVGEYLENIGMELHHVPRVGLYRITSSMAVYDSTFIMYAIPPSNQTASTETPKLVFATWGTQRDQWMYECSLRSALVELNLVCDSLECYVDRIRRLSKPREERDMSAQGTTYDIVHNPATLWNFIESLTNMIPFSNNPHPIDSYIFGEDIWSTYGTIGASSHDWATINVSDISNRITRLLNMCADTSRWGNAVKYDWQSELNADDIASLPMITSAQARITTPVQQYRAHGPWVFSLILCSTILLLLGLVSLVLLFTTNVPDIFGYVSSLTRDNPYIAIPGGGAGSTLDGADRARLLRKMEVQLGDVEPDKEVGYIAFRSVDDEKDRARGKVEKSRLYR